MKAQIKITSNQEVEIETMGIDIVNLTIRQKGNEQAITLECSSTQIDDIIESLTTIRNSQKRRRKG